MVLLHWQVASVKDYPALCLGKVEEKVGIPLPSWTNRYRQVLERLLDLQLVDGTIKDGYLAKEPAEGSPLRALHPLIRWSWLELAAGGVYDPSIWVSKCYPFRVRLAPTGPYVQPSSYYKLPPVLKPGSLIVRLDLKDEDKHNILKSLGYPPAVSLEQLEWYVSQTDLFRDRSHPVTCLLREARFFLRGTYAKCHES